jgi:malate/lactate dehydrogenase
VAAGTNQKPGDTRLNLPKDNAAVFQKIIPEIARHAPNAILLIATNPVDVLTYASWKLSGFPTSRVIGSGTILDRSRSHQQYCSCLASFGQKCNFGLAETLSGRLRTTENRQE